MLKDLGFGGMFDSKHILGLKNNLNGGEIYGAVFVASHTPPGVYPDGGAKVTLSQACACMFLPIRTGVGRYRSPVVIDIYRPF